MTLPLLEPLEVHSGIVFGPARGTVARKEPTPASTPREVLEELLVPALAAPPCHVMFSGGRDSSIVLAAAVQVARREGLEPPIPLTAVHPDLPEADEEDWQNRVVQHLGLSEWRRETFHHEFDLLGPDARAALSNHGLFWPAPALSILVLGRVAGGGTVVTGGGGDEIFSPWPWQRVPVRQILALRPRRRIAKWLPFYCLPLPVRQRLLEGKGEETLSWLTPDALAELNARMDHAETPVSSFAAELDRYLGSRYLECLGATMSTLAADRGVDLHEPFYDHRFVRAVSVVAPRTGWPSRHEALESLFVDILPSDILRRSSKAHFTRSGWGPDATAFVREWDGTGVDEALVDVDRLREEWTRDPPDARSATLLQHAWLRQRSEV